MNLLNQLSPEKRKAIENYKYKHTSDMVIKELKSTMFPLKLSLHTATSLMDIFEPLDTFNLTHLIKLFK